MSSTVSIAQYAARAEAAEAKIAELTSLAAQIQAVAGGASGSSGSGEAGLGEFKNYFLEKLKTLRAVVAEEHEEFVRTQAKNSELEKEATKLRYRVEILTRELSAKLGTPVPESIFKDFKEETEAPKEAKNENPKEKDKGKEKEKDKKGEKEKDKKGEKGEKEKDKKGEKGEKEKDKKGEKEKDKKGEKGEKEKDKKGEKGEKEKDKKGERKPSEKAERKPSEKAERKPSERKQSEKAETPAETSASTEPAVTVHAAEGTDKGKQAAKQGKKEGAAKKDSTRTESEKGEAPAAADTKKGGKADAKKGGDAQKKGGDNQKKGGDNQKKGGEAAKKEGDKPKEEKKAGELDDKAVKASLKEGGKKAQDCVGMSTFGTHFFCITVESADGKMKLLEKVMEGMNAEVDEEAEDRKGGAADLGKILFNANDQKLVIMCHTPKEVADKATAADWMKPVLEATGAKITSQTEDIVQAELDNDPDHGIYSLKLRDQGISASFEFLRSRGLMIEDDSDDENYAAAAGINLNAAPGADY